MASAAIPLVFPAVRLPSGFYGDGSIRRTAPLAPAIHIGAGRVLAISMRSAMPIEGPSVPIGHYPAAAEVMLTGQDVDGPIHAKAMTDEKGRFEIPEALPPGEYTLTARRLKVPNPLLAIVDLQKSKTTLTITEVKSYEVDLNIPGK